MIRFTKILFGAALTSMISTSFSLHGAEHSSDALKEELAQTYGIEAFADVSEVGFTFLVDIKGETVAERKWLWKPASKTVVFYPSEGEPVEFQRHDPEQADLEGKFVNDSYWLVFPFKVYWDESAVLSEAEGQMEAPISGTPMRKITVNHPPNVGFTPGDAYDLYLDDEGIVREWVFRKGGQSEPTRLSTWEDYQTLSGVKMALDHHGPGEFRVYFEDVTVD